MILLESPELKKCQRTPEKKKKSRLMKKGAALEINLKSLFFFTETEEPIEAVFILILAFHTIFGSPT